MKWKNNIVYLLNAFHFALRKRGGHIPGRCLGGSFGNASVTLIGAFRFLACTCSEHFWHRSPWRVPASLDGESAPTAVFFLTAQWLGGVAGVVSRTEQQMSCTLSPSSAGSIPAGNSLCLPCIHLQIQMEAVCTAVVSVVGRVRVFLSVGTSPRSAFGSRGFCSPAGRILPECPVILVPMNSSVHINTIIYRDQLPFPNHTQHL